MLECYRKDNLRILSDEESVNVADDHGAVVNWEKALEDCAVGSTKLSIEQLVWIRNAVCQMMANDGVIESDPKSWV